MNLDRLKNNSVVLNKIGLSQKPLLTISKSLRLLAKAHPKEPNKSLTK